MCQTQQVQQQQQQQEPEQEQAKAKRQMVADGSSPPNAAYAMYLHREELRRRKMHYARASQTKIQLTSELIAKSKLNISKCSSEDLQILARQTVFKKNLQRHLHYRRMQIVAWRMAKRQEHCKKQSEAQN